MFILKSLKNVNHLSRLKKNICPVCHCSKLTTANSDNYYVSTPIYYVNAEPHIGHLYSTLIADTLARWARLSASHRNVTFSTGTDEHGLKIQQAASKAKQENQIFCDKVSSKFKSLFDNSDISYTHFIRTTDKVHRKTAQALWKRIDDNGHIYRGKYEGWYSTQDEAFLQNDDCVEDGQGNMISKESGHIVEWITEDNYMFKLSSFREPLLKWIKDKKPIIPSQFEPIVTAWLTSADLPDLSISRSTRRLQWGVDIPGDNTQKMYVWMDALSNYLTAMDYLTGSKFTWPPTVQVIGKDILKFHAVYWPALLMASDLEPPRQILAHSHWTIEGKKMSKSKGNVVDPRELIAKYDSESVRYFLLRQGVPHSDSNFSESRLVSLVNDELVNTLCNLLSRCCSERLNPSQKVTSYNKELIDESLMEELDKLPGIADTHYNEGNVYRVLESNMAYLKSVNAFVQRTQPWSLRKRRGLRERRGSGKDDGEGAGDAGGDEDDQGDEDEMAREQLADSVVAFALHSVQVSAILLQPVIPRTCEKILDKLSVSKQLRILAAIDQPHLQPQTPRHLSAHSNVIFQRIKQ